MRRQVKPFVTEYRGTPRRHKDQSGAADPQPDTAVARHRPLSDQPRPSGSDAADTSYEAALRAADALFAAPPRGRSNAAAPVPQPDPWTPRSEARPPDLADVDAGTTMTEAAELAPAADKLATSPGRILQAIEPQAEDRFAALEAERAPKRRGRKPGSKNKPKSLIGDDWPTTARGVVADASPISLAVPEPAPPVVVALERPGDVIGLDEDVSVFTDDAEATPHGRARPDRFGWKRSELRPGERWKRRLPKAAW